MANAQNKYSLHYAVFIIFTLSYSGCEYQFSIDNQFASIHTFLKLSVPLDLQWNRLSIKSSVVVVF